MDVDSALLRLGKFGRWQVTRWVALGFSGYFSLSVNLLSIIFLGQFYAHRCNIPGNRTLQESIPNVTNDGVTSLDTCRMFVNETNVTSSCQYGYHYLAPEGATSIVTEFNLVCSLNYLSDLSQTVYNIGLCVSNFFITALADRFGRRHVHLISAILLAVFNLAVAFSPDFLTFVIIRFFAGILVDGSFSAAFVLLTEHFPHRYRNNATTMWVIFWVVGETTLTTLSLLLPNWRHLQIAIAIPGFISIVFYWLIDESIPWLAAVGRTKEAERLLRKAAKINKIPDTDWSLQSQPSFKQKENIVKYQKVGQDSESLTSSGTVRRETLLDVLKHRKLCLQLIIICSLWICNNIVYYGIILGIGALAGNLHINMYILSAFDVLSILTVLLVDRRWSKKIGFCGGQIIAGLALIIAVFIPAKSVEGKDLSYLVTIVTMIGKVAITTSFCSVALYTPEVFPTQTRNLTFGIAMTVGRLGAIVAPSYAYLTRLDPWLPSIICGSLSVVVGLAGIYLPQTKGRPLFQTIAELDAWTRKNKSGSHTDTRYRKKVGSRLADVKETVS